MSAGLGGGTHTTVQDPRAVPAPSLSRLSFASKPTPRLVQKEAHHRAQPEAPTPWEVAQIEDVARAISFGWILKRMCFPRSLIRSHPRSLIRSHS